MFDMLFEVIFHLSVSCKLQVNEVIRIMSFIDIQPLLLLQHLVYVYLINTTLVKDGGLELTFMQ